MERDDRPVKRQKHEHEHEHEHEHVQESATYASRQPNGSISPPLLRRAPKVVDVMPQAKSNVKVISSPFRLTNIRDLPIDDNIDAVRLQDLVGDPLIHECWHFNFLFDVDFVMSAFDVDTRSLVDVKIIHGSWKKEDTNRQRLEAGALRYPNVQVIRAYMPEPFGTHHSKAMVLFRHDDTCQVIIHTANMIERDWTNLSQAAWISPALPLLTDPATSRASEMARAEIGTGKRFKQDLIRYFEAYGEGRTGPLVGKLRLYDFTAIRAAFIASSPGKERVTRASDTPARTSWGWEGVRDTLRAVPCLKNSGGSKSPVLVVEVSSIASLGTDDTWLSNFRNVLSMSKDRDHGLKYPICRVVFPTANEIRNSLDGYDSGNSIHTKIQSPRNMKQLSYLRPMLCHWAGTSIDPNQPPRAAGRRRAAPHIKTYVRFTDSSMTQIDWAMITSANLSTQAWGGVARDGEYKVSSWEMGVLVWPALLVDHGHTMGQEERQVAMVPTFKKDMPVASEHLDVADVQTLVGLRMPYDLPLVRYEATEVPWCATLDHAEPDCKGETWVVWSAGT